MPQKIEPAHGLFRLIVSDDGLEVKAEFLRETDEATMRGHLRASLTEAGIVNGVEPVYIERGIKADKLKTPFVVAKGTPPKPPTDGTWEILITTAKSLKPKKRLDGTVDYHDVHSFEEVKEGQPLVRRHDPRPGVPGKDCRGKVVPPKAPVSPSWTLGAGTRFSPSDPGLVEAARRGIVKAGRGQIAVEDKMQIQGSVDFQTGDIETGVPVVISEDIRAGFSVKSQQGVEIRGCMVGARLEAGGNTLIRGGVVGDERPTVKVKGDLRVHYLQHARVEVTGDLIVDKSVTDAWILCAGKVTIGGALVASEVVAGESVDIATLGSEMGGSSRVFAGLDAKARMALFRICVERGESEQELRRLHQEHEGQRQMASSAEMSGTPGVSNKTMATGEDSIAKNRDFVQRQGELDGLLTSLAAKEDELLASAPPPGPDAIVKVKRGVVSKSWVALGPQKLELPGDSPGPSEFRYQSLPA